MEMTTDCVYCMLNYMDKTFKLVDDDASLHTEYMKKACGVIAQAEQGCSPPEINRQIMRLITEHAGRDDIFEREKYEYNEAIMKMEDVIGQRIEEAEDPLYRALQYAMTGNYIDFAATSVNEDKLNELIEAAVDIDLGSTYTELKEDLEQASSLVYLLDNCGEIVFDKMCIKEIKELYPSLKITAVVRGMPTNNDVTMIDAKQTRLTELVDVADNGSDAPGTVLGEIKKSTLKLIEEADVVIAKGMGNYETMVGCGLGVYYIFLCKCARFVQEFGLPRYSGVLVKETE